MFLLSLSETIYSHTTPIATVLPLAGASMETGWNLTAPPGFQGLHPDKPVTVYHRHLPHWRQVGATYFVTFRLEDSLPQSKVNELKAIRTEWERKHATLPVGRNCIPSTSDLASVLSANKDAESLAKVLMSHVERWLDEGMGSCLLQEPDAMREVANALHFFDDDRYELDCYVIMPNHVHAILKPLWAEVHPLERILQSWKRHTARKINERFGRQESLWQEESFDRMVRDEEHLYRVIQYIGRNPQKAGLAENEYRLWIRPAWENLGWKFERHP